MALFSGPVVCNFLDGLNEMLIKRRLSSSTTSTLDQLATTQDTWILRAEERRELIESVASDTASPAALRMSTQPLVHSYSSSPYAEEQYVAFHHDAGEESDSVPETTPDDRRDGNDADIFSRDYFDESFYNQLFKLVASSDWRRTNSRLPESNS
jgi:hypothetical protein